MNKVYKLKNGDYIKRINERDGVSVITGEMYNELKEDSFEKNLKLFSKSTGNLYRDEEKIKEFISTFDLKGPVNKNYQLPPGFAFATGEDGELRMDLVDTLISEGYCEFENLTVITSDEIYIDIKNFEKLIKKYFQFNNVKEKLDQAKDTMFDLFKKITVQEKVKELENLDNGIALCSDFLEKSLCQK